jgi:serine protease Do
MRLTMVATQTLVADLAAAAASLDTDLVQMIAAVQHSVVQVRSGRHGAGSGIIWQASGVIMTNHHVVARSDQASVLLYDGRELAASVTARDPILDLAILQVAASELPAARIGASERLRVGEVVVAVGNPWGQRGVATLGIVSGVGEIATPWRRASAEYIRSDVQLAPGNSGGPLVNARGEVVGINAMIFGGDLSVAIPAHIASQFLAVAQSEGPTLGVAVQSIPLPQAWQAAAQREHGLLVVGLEDDGLAAQAGLYVGDILLDVRGKPLVDPHVLRYALVNRADAAPLTLRYLRGDQVQTLTI